MKTLIFPFMLLLAGCGALPSDVNNLWGNPSLLDVAPKDEYALMHPEWGYAPQTAQVTVYGQGSAPAVKPGRVVSTSLQANGKQTMTRSTFSSPSSQMKGHNYDSLESFLLDNGIDYEVLPGNHVMVKVKDMIKFNTGSASVSAESQRWLERVGHYIAGQRGIDIVINGHTDNTGTSAFNDQLSVKRANAVKQQLLSSQVTREAIYTRGFGEYVPECSNQTASGKACNRRVEVMFIVAN